MNQNVIATLLFLNIAATAGLGGWMASRKAETAKGSDPATALREPVEALGKELHSLNTTVQRMNTSLVQYDFLEKELENLSVLERNLAVRGQAQLQAKTPENAADTDKALKQIGELLKKVGEEKKARRQTMLQLIGGLERQLAGLTGAPTIADKVPAEPPATSAEDAGKTDGR